MTVKATILLGPGLEDKNMYIQDLRTWFVGCFLASLLGWMDRFFFFYIIRVLLLNLFATRWLGPPTDPIIPFDLVFVYVTKLKTARDSVDIVYNWHPPRLRLRCLPPAPIILLVKPTKQKEDNNRRVNRHTHTKGNSLCLYDMILLL